MKKFRIQSAIVGSALLASSAALAGHADPAAPINILVAVGFVLLIIVVGAGVFFARTRDPKAAPLTTVLGDKRPDPHAVGPEVSVQDCVRKINDEKSGAVLIVEGEQLLGIFTERDALNKVLAAGLDPASTTVSEVMTPDPTVITPDTKVEDALQIVTEKRIRHLPIVQDGRVLGMVTSADLTHWVVKDEAKEIQHLVDIAEGT
jgi:CBS domain-containing protein